MTTTELLNTLYAAVESIWSMDSPLSSANISRLHSLVTQIRTISDLTGDAIRPSLPMSTNVAGLAQEHTNRKEASDEDIDLDMDLDEIAAQLKKERRPPGMLVGVEAYYDVHAKPGTKIPKSSLGHVRQCIINCEGEMHPSWTLVATEGSLKRMADSMPMTICKNHHTTIEELQRCTFAHKLDTLRDIVTGRTLADVVRANPAVMQALNKPDSTCKYLNYKGETAEISLDRVVQNAMSIQALVDGRGRECTREDPHNCVSCTFVHRIMSAKTTVVVSHQLYRLRDLVDNEGKEVLVTCKHSAGTVCKSTKPHNPAKCKFIHLVSGAKPIEEPNRTAATFESADSAFGKREKQASELKASLERTLEDAE